ncbi:MAG: phytoene/squalene synthase family protein [Bacteroidales bacterium]
MDIYTNTAFSISENVTKHYSTSFYSATRFFDTESRKAIFSIYGFVRFADEIVDTFHEFDKATLLQKFENDYYDAMKQGISLNPVLHSFQITVKKYRITDDLVQAFLRSMKYDLEKTEYANRAEIDDYIFGSADVVGLMCLKVFCNGNDSEYHELKHSAMKLGSAFQKVNFLRDLKNDVENLGRCYFPNVGKSSFDERAKSLIIDEIQNDFDEAYKGIQQLPKNAKLPVLIAYTYYLALLHKIKRTPAERIMTERIRVSNFQKTLLIGNAYLLYFRHKFEPKQLFFGFNPMKEVL